MAEPLPRDLLAEIRQLEEENRRLRAGIRDLRKQNQDLQGRSQDIQARQADLQTQIDKLKARKNELEARERRLETQKGELEKLVERLQRRVVALEAQVAELSQALEQSRRAEKRQAAPFSKGAPRTNPKKPGRKPGRRYGVKAHRFPPQPEQIDEVYDVPLPSACPHCAGTEAIVETGTAVQYQTEIPRRPIHRKFHVHLGRCKNCDRPVQGRHELQTSDALGAAAAQLGPDAQAAAVYLHQRAGLSCGKVAAVFEQLFGISISRGGVAQVVLRAAARLQAEDSEIRARIRGSPQVAVDETGWRIGGRPAWLHVATTAEATCFTVAQTRGVEPAARVLGEDYPGVLVHDGWSAYGRFVEALHQQCVWHAMRRARELADAAADERSGRFPRRVLTLFEDALECRDLYRSGQATVEALAQAALQFVADLRKLTSRRYANPRYAKFARHLRRHLWEWFLFLIIPGVEATTHQAEQALRRPIVNRKVWGGNRTPRGAKAQDVLSSVLETCARQGLSLLTFVSDTLRGRHPQLFASLPT